MYYRMEKTRIPPQNTCKTVETQSNIEREPVETLFTVFKV